MRSPFALLSALLVAVVTGTAMASSLTVDSSAFWNGGAIPPLDSAAIDGCRGRNISPPLRITGVPPDARSLGVVVFDTDANHGAGFVHWVAYGIAPSTGSLPSGFGTVPGAYVGGKNDAGTSLYFGPCPPPGDPPHHYQFSVYALTLAPAQLPAGLTRAAFLRATAAHTLAVGTLTGTFGR
jgi:Raf kinase inhibitor-like YbhB/YbcL family protein